MSTRIIHETILKDIIDLWDDAKDIAGDQVRGFRNGKDSFTSLTRDTNNLILVFPVLCTKGVSIETASMVSKAIEKRCVTLLQILLSSIQFSDAENLQDYISKFHRNISIGGKIGINDFITFLDDIDSRISEGAIIISDRDSYNLFKESLNEINNIAKVSLNEKALSTFEITKVGNNEIIQEAIEKNNIKGRYTINTINNRESNSKFNEYLSNNDIKKANELMPTKVTINFTKLTDNGPVPYTNGIIGVKCKLYVVDSLEIIERVSSKYADSNWVRELVRASTGEISFWRDFVFALDRARIDAINTTKRGSTSQMFKVLERRALKNRLSKWKANKADCSPITTLIVNQDEVEYLKKDYSIDLENRNMALKLMDSYNFMGLVIVDEPAESASFIWDSGNEANYETLSFRNLERESDDKNYRKVINLMTKISR